jgi:hypothetical protein
MKRVVVVLVVGALGLGVAALAAWALDSSLPDPAAYAAAAADPAVVIGSHDGFITIRPAASQPTVGLLFYPGARVPPSAYVAKLSAVAVAANLQIAVGRPPLHWAIFSMDQADDMRAALPGVTRWYVGGHSLGGAVACHYADGHRDILEGVILFGTYCGSDLAGSSLRVLSVTGDSDGLFPPEKISAHRGELPGGARMVQVRGMNHAQFGDYGAQSGDHPATVSDAVARRELAKAVAEFFTEHQERSTP